MGKKVNKIKSRRKLIQYVVSNRGCWPVGEFSLSCQWRHLKGTTAVFKRRTLMNLPNEQYPARCSREQTTHRLISDRGSDTF